MLTDRVPAPHKPRPRTAAMLVLSSRMRKQFRASASGVCDSWLALISLMMRLRQAVGRLRGCADRGCRPNPRCTRLTCCDQVCPEPNQTA